MNKQQEEIDKLMDEFVDKFPASAALMVTANEMGISIEDVYDSLTPELQLLCVVEFIGGAKEEAQKIKTLQTMVKEARYN